MTHKIHSFNTKRSDASGLFVVLGRLEEVQLSPIKYAFETLTRLISNRCDRL